MTGQKQHSVFTIHYQKINGMPSKGSQANGTKVHDASFIFQLRARQGCGKQEVMITHGEQNLELQIM